MDRDTAEIIVSDFDLASVQASSNFTFERFHALAQPACALNCAARTIEISKRTIPCKFDYTTTVHLNQLFCEAVMFVRDRPPFLITKLPKLLGGTRAP